MKKHLKLDIFPVISSDVFEEREILDGVIKDLNNIWMDTLGVMLKVKKWESHVSSKITNQNLNDIIIDEMDDYDIYIGIMWKEYGTPTNGYKSGTEQEFRVALDNFEKNGKPLIKFYFSKREFTSDFGNVEQYVNIKNFKNELKEKGIIKYYKSIEEFKYILFMELSSCIKDEFIKNSGD